MQLLDIKRVAHSILENQNIESSFIEYKKTANFKDKILKTTCAFANNYMNNEIGLLFIGVEEVDDKETGEKAIPKRPIEGVKESKIEGVENELKSLFSNIHPKINYHIIIDKMDDEYYLVVAVESGGNGPFQTSERAEKDKSIRLKAGRYIRVGRDSRLPNPTEEFELLKKFAGFSFSSNLNAVATIDDLSYEYMKEYLLETGAKKDIREMSKLNMAKSMELATNAILHKEYDTPEYVGIYIYRDRISFVNHNRPLPPVTIEALNRERSFDRRQYLNKELKDMFFALNLIESYGSGIRRAKDALLENGSPELKFYPDNEEDNYTNAIIGINTEFLKEFRDSTTQETTQEITQETTQETTKEMKMEKPVPDKIVELMITEPSITARQIAEQLDVSFDGVRYHIKKLRADGMITREGSTKSGKWVVVK